jgi:ribokinase
VRVAVVGHTEWVEFLRVAHVPAPGEIVFTEDTFFEPAGGGAVAAVQLARLAGDALFFTAVGADEIGRATVSRLSELGVRVAAAERDDEPSRRAYTYADDNAERTITVIGKKLLPRFADPLPWEQLAGMDAVFFVAGDTGALRACRAARVLVGTAREVPTFAAGGVVLDALVGSGRDRGEVYSPGDISPPPALVVRTAGAEGGTWAQEERTGSFRAVEPPGPPVDAYGCGDSFAAGLTYGLGAGLALEEALELAARCGATCLTGRGPYERQLTL